MSRRRSILKASNYQKNIEDDTCRLFEDEEDTRTQKTVTFNKKSKVRNIMPVRDLQKNSWSYEPDEFTFNSNNVKKQPRKSRKSIFRVREDQLYESDTTYDPIMQSLKPLPTARENTIAKPFNYRVYF